MKQILYGVGKSLLQDFRDPTKTIAYSDLQDLSVESSSSKEDITGGDKMFAIASFDKEKAIKVSATNATFSDEMLPYLDGMEAETGAKTLTTYVEVEIPADGIVTLEQTPLAETVIVNGFEKAETAATGKFTVTEKNITFDATDAGKLVNIVYDYTSGANTKEYSVTQKSMKKPFRFTHRVPIYDEDSQPIANLQLVIYKAQCSSGVKFDLKHQTPFAPQFEAEAKDASRADKKLWSCYIEPLSDSI